MRWLTEEQLRVLVEMTIEAERGIEIAFEFGDDDLLLYKELVELGFVNVAEVVCPDDPDFVQDRYDITSRGHVALRAHQAFLALLS